MRRLLIACALAYVPACAKSRKAETNEPSKLEATDSVAVAVVRELMARRASDSSRMSLTLSAGDQSRLDALRLKVPRILTNFCQGEGCSFGYSLVACTALTLRAADDSSSPEVGRVAVGDTVLVETGNLYVHVPGIAVMRRAAVVEYDTVPYEHAALEDSMRLATGDTVRFLEYYGEGNWGVAHKGRVVFVQEFWPRLGFPSRWDEENPAITLSAPQDIQWLRLQPRHGSAGWWQEESSNTARPEWDERCAPTS